jgi:integrase
VKVADPDFVCGRRGNYQLQPPITHPPFCVCRVCPEHRKRSAAENGRTLSEEWALPVVIRTRRASPYPNKRVESATAAANLIVQEEARLIAAVKAAEDAKRAKQNAKSFGDIADAYRRYLQSEGKRYDKASSRIDNIEALVGRERDANAIDIGVYREVLSEVSQLEPQTRRHYGSTLLAMMNNAKAEGIITSHALADVRLPSAKKSDTPVTWTRAELAVITGPALDQWEREQAAWNGRVGKVEGTGSLRAPSHMPLRGMIYIAYFTLMRPKNNRALTWEEVTLDPVRRTGSFRLNHHKNVNKGVKAYGRLARKLVDYLLAIRPRNARGVIHPNPATGKPYVDIRKQWDRLIQIASGMLGYALIEQKADFFTFRHTGATHAAERASDRDELMRVVNMMGDTNVETVRRHYFNFQYEEDEQMIDGWDLPEFDAAEHARLAANAESEITN